MGYGSIPATKEGALTPSPCQPPESAWHRGQGRPPQPVWMDTEAQDCCEAEWNSHSWVLLRKGHCHPGIFVLAIPPQVERECDKVTYILCSQAGVSVFIKKYEVNRNLNSL